MSDPASGKATRWLAAILLGTFVAQLLHFFSLSLPQQVREIPDDSFFYLQLGLRYWQAGEFTFDGDSQTYGFQPLWQLLMIALAALLPTAKSLFLGAFVLCAALHTTIAFQLYRLSSACFGVRTGIITALLWAWNPAIMSWCWGLKENALYALLLVIALRHLLHALCGSMTTRNAVSFGVVLGVMMFNRINSLTAAGILLGTLVVAWGLGDGMRSRLRGTLIAGGVATLVAAPWYVFAWFHFGTAMPTSGTFKLALMKAHVEVTWQAPWLSFAHARHALALWPDYIAFLFASSFGLLRPVLLAAAACWPILALIARTSKTRTPVVPKGSAPMLWLATALLASAFVSSFSNQMVLPNYLGYARWYAVPEYVSFAFIGGGLFGACWRLRGRTIGMALAAASLAVSFWLWPARVDLPHLDERAVFAEAPEKAQLLELGQWANRHVPAEVAGETPGFGIWDPGIVSYFSGKRFVSFDPLMNSLEYQQQDILNPVGYIKKCRIAYMIGVADRFQDRWRYIPLPPNEYEIVWLPYPDRGVGFGSSGSDHTVLVRPLSSPVPAFLSENDFPCGILYPNDAKRRRVVTRDRDRLLNGEAKAADVVRLWLHLPGDGQLLELRANDQVVQSFAAGTKGFVSVDVRAYRGQRLSLVRESGDLTNVVEQAHLVDWSW